MSRRGAVVAGVALAIAVACGFGSGLAYDRWVVQHGLSPTEPADARDSFGVFWEAWRLVEDQYVDRSVVTPVNLTHGAIGGMLDALGDTGHTRFLNASDRRAEENSLAGKLTGIGIEVESRDGRTVVVAPLDGSPAQRAGIISGDVIEKINDQDATKMSLDEVGRLIRGTQGTSVKLTMLRPSLGQLLEFTIVREDVKVPDVTWSTIPGEKIIHIRISSFGQDSGTQLRAAITQAKKDGDTGIVLDLRNDPGGLLDQAIRVSSEFLTSGDVLLEQDRSGKREPDRVVSGGTAPSDPLVVMVNHGTASAAEIVAGALQDQHRATVIGEQTFGTGTVLKEFPLSDGSAILLGVREWLTPNGHSIRGSGITPDQIVAQPATTRSLTPSGERSLTAEQVAASGDSQLLEAIKVLH